MSTHLNSCISTSRSLAAAFFVAAFLFACQQPKPHRDPRIAKGSVESAYLLWRNAAASIDPASATERGDRRFDTQLSPVTRELVTSCIESLQRSREMLVEIDNFDLSPDARADRDLLLGRVDADLLNLTKIKPFERQPLWIVENLARAISSLEFAPQLSNEARLEALAGRLAAMPAYLETARRGSRLPSQVHCELALEVTNALLEHLDSGFFTMAGLSANANQTELLNSARESLTSYRDWLVERVAAGPDGHHRIGRENFEKLMAAESGIPLTVKNISDLGEAELEGARRRFLNAAAAAYPNCESDDELVKAALAALDQGRAIDTKDLPGITKSALDFAYEIATKGDFGPIPTNLKTEPYAERAVRSGAALAHADIINAGNTINGADANKNGAAVFAAFHVSNPNSSFGAGLRRAWYSSLSPARLRLLALAETVPGKAFARAIRANLTNPVRRDTALAGWELGWGDYARRASIHNIDTLDATVASTFTIAQAAQDALVSARALVATRIHGGTMSVAEATEIFRRRAFLESEMAEREAKRCAADPTLALELIGRTEFEKIFQQLRERNTLSAASIHSLILQKGALPFSTLRASVLGVN
ncbi:MAG: DUF885 family protein [Planctomycetota bacterium]